MVSTFSLLAILLDSRFSNHLSILLFYFSDIGREPLLGKCVACNPGYSSPAGVKCYPARPGFYIPKSGASTFIACLPGTFSGDAAIQCTTCTSPLYSGPAATQCIACSNGSSSSDGKTCVP